ncbi:MAG: hypothetical protein V4696_03560 [Pseudomonadota bacterium]
MSIVVVKEALRNLRGALSQIGVRHRWSLVIHDKREAQAIRLMEQRAFEDGLAARDPARRFDKRVLILLGGVPFLGISEDNDDREVINAAKRAIDFLERGAVQTKEKQGHLNALNEAIDRLDQLQIGG